MPDPYCNRHPAIMCDDVYTHYTRMSYTYVLAGGLVYKQTIGTYSLFNKSSLIHCKLIQNRTLREAILQMAKIIASSNET